MRQIDTRKFSVVTLLLLLMSVNAVALANTLERITQDNGSTETQGFHDRFANMTDGEFKEYSDSLYASLYPEAYLCEADSATFDHLSEDDPVMTTANAVSPIPDAVELDRSKAVGQIVINSGTNQFGAKTYEVPIEVYPGMHGMTPQLSLSYNSLSGN